MDANEYQRLALRTESSGGFEAPTNLTVMRLLHSSIGLCTEAGELADILKKYLYYGAEIDPLHVFEEFGDLLWYIAIGVDAAHKLSEWKGPFTLADVMNMNIQKLRQRYPQRFSEANALNRDLCAEKNAMQAGLGEMSDEPPPPRKCPVCGLRDEWWSGMITNLHAYYRSLLSDVCRSANPFLSPEQIDGIITAAKEAKPPRLYAIGSGTIGHP